MHKVGKITVLFLIFILGCANSENDPTVLKFWAMGAEGEYVAQLLPEFEKENPNIKVKVQQVPWTAAQEKLITAFASDKLPDVFQLGNTWVPQFHSLSAIENLSKYVEKSTGIDESNYFPGIWDTNVLDSTVYGIPWYIDTRVLYYRSDIFKRAGYDHPPRTWDELYEVSKSIKKMLADENKYAIYLPSNEWAHFVIWGLQNNAKLLKSNNSYGNFSSPEFKEAFAFLTQFHKEKLAPIGMTEVNNVFQAFKDEYFSMYISGPWNIKDFKLWLTDSLENCWMIAPLPAPTDEYPGASLAGGSSLVINSKSELKQEAWKLIEFLSRKKVQIEFYKLLNDLPAVKSAWMDSIFVNDEYMKVFYTQFLNVKATPKIAEWEQIAFSKIQQYAEYTVREVMTVDEALAALDKDINEILKKRRWLLDKNDK